MRKAASSIDALKREQGVLSPWRETGRVRPVVTESEDFSDWKSNWMVQHVPLLFWKRWERSFQVGKVWSFSRMITLITGFFVAGRQEAEKGLCGSDCIWFLSFTRDICECQVLSRNFCYFLKILNHRWQKNALKDNPLTLSPGHLFCGLQFSVQRFFPLFLSTWLQSWWGKVKCKQSWDVHYPSPAKPRGFKDLWRRMTRGLPRLEVGREGGGEDSRNCTESLQQRLHPRSLLEVVLLCAAL